MMQLNMLRLLICLCRGTLEKIVIANSNKRARDADIHFDKWMLLLQTVQSVPVCSVRHWVAFGKPNGFLYSSKQADIIFYSIKDKALLFNSMQCIHLKAI